MSMRPHTMTRMCPRRIAMWRPARPAATSGVRDDSIGLRPVTGLTVGPERAAMDVLVAAHAGRRHQVVKNGLVRSSLGGGDLGRSGDRRGGSLDGSLRAGPGGGIDGGLAGDRLVASLAARGEMRAGEEGPQLALPAMGVARDRERVIRVAALTGLLQLAAMRILVAHRAFGPDAAEPPGRAPPGREGSRLDLVACVARCLFASWRSVLSSSQRADALARPLGSSQPSPCASCTLRPRARSGRK